MKTLILLTILASMTHVFAQVPDLKKMDKLETCVSDTQKNSANNALIFLENFKWWKIKNLVHSLHPEYKEWHASRVYLATLYPLSQVPNLPYKDGQVDAAHFLANIARIAYTNDVPKYTIDISRLECVSDDTVVISSIFNGVNVYRDAKGVALYQTAITNVPTRFVITIKDGLIYRNIINLEDTTTKKMIDELAALIKAGVSNVVPGTIPDKTYEEILADFQRQVNN